jgi:SAM-dependent methyltransferase
MSESLLDFYRRHQISPVRQDIRDLRVHFARRAALYRHLGILPAFLRGRTVLEIGPGSGSNSVYTASLEPARYVLVEANPRGVDDIRTLFSLYPAFAECVEVICETVDDYEGNAPFDFVFCEGVLALAGVPDPGRLLRKVAAHTAPGGVLVITCIDAISDFPETLRRLLAQLVVDPADSLPAQVERLLPIFAPHLSTLAGMSRRHDDWIIDNLLNPASIGPLLSIADAMTALDGEFDAFGASPHFLTDWRWYKAIGPNDRLNDLARDEYWANVHNLLDYRHLSPPRDGAANRRLYEACNRARMMVQEYERDRDRAIVTAIVRALDSIVATVGTFSPETGEALAELRDILAQPFIDTAEVAASVRFAAWFGRGQQYLSFSRRSTEDRRSSEEVTTDQR